MEIMPFVFTFPCNLSTQWLPSVAMATSLLVFSFFSPFLSSSTVPKAEAVVQNNL